MVFISAAWELLFQALLYCLPILSVSPLSCFPYHPLTLITWYFFPFELMYHQPSKLVPACSLSLVNWFFRTL